MRVKANASPSSSTCWRQSTASRDRDRVGLALLVGFRPGIAHLVIALDCLAAGSLGRIAGHGIGLRETGGRRIFPHECALHDRTVGLALLPGAVLIDVIDLL